ncbi:MAG TPA: HD domain-containing protein [Candidatus Hydrogenedentes bacterium]|nr:HD domain-containing protein [Candidatus Hydrogenedentota bacterium]
MKNQYVNMLQEGDYINDYFVAIRKDLRAKQNGGKFLGMVFKDKTGEIGGVLWNNATEVAKLFELGDVVNVRGRVSTYQNRLQVQVDQVLPLRETDYNLADLVATITTTPNDLQTFRAIFDAVENPFLKQLVHLFLNDAEFMDQFTAAAAAKKWHHEFRGGLLRHCLEMARIALTMCELFPELDKDVLLTAVLLHDAGKIHEMSHELYVDYTNAGKLLGHLQIGCDMVQARINTIPGFPEKLRLQILHCILSHHGELINGSPVVPKTLEAIVLHHIDNLDAQAAAFTRIIEETRENGQEWSEYLPLIERVIWTKGNA